MTENKDDKKYADIEAKLTDAERAALKELKENEPVVEEGKVDVTGSDLEAVTEIEPSAEPETFTLTKSQLDERVNAAYKSGYVNGTREKVKSKIRGIVETSLYVGICAAVSVGVVGIIKYISNPSEYRVQSKKLSNEISELWDLEHQNNDEIRNLNYE